SGRPAGAAGPAEAAPRSDAAEAEPSACGDGFGGSCAFAAPLSGASRICPADAALDCGAAEADAPPITATTLFTGTVSPSLTRISETTPAAGDGTSVSTLSVEISKSGSSRSTVSPTFFIQRTTVPSAIDSPICGMTTSVAIGAPLQMYRRAVDCVRRLADRFREGRVRVNRANQVFDGRLEPQSRRRFGDQLGRPRADHCA